MLFLLTSPAWAAESAAPQALPLTVRGALLAVLATHNDWLTRAELALIFWPDASPSEALHRLSINLHRSRALLIGWGQHDALESGRLRLRLPPLDALTAQTRLVEALARAFEALTPVLLVDDLQWCDTATVEWLAMLAHSGRLRWRATVRPHELAAGVAQTVRALAQAARFEALEVMPLGRAAAEEICLSRWPELSFSEAHLDRLFDMNGGNTFVLCELVAANASIHCDDDIHPPQALDRVRSLVQRRLQALPLSARIAVEASAVFAQTVPGEALQVPTLMGVTALQQPSDPQWSSALDTAVAAGLLRVYAEGLVCRHDLIRHAVADGLPAARRVALHRHAALWLAILTDVDALTVAEHWRAAAEPQTALAWSHRAAEQLKARGSFDEARALWREVMDASTEVALRLRAQLDLAACDLFDNLAHGEAALNAVCAQLNAVAEPDQRRHIEAAALAALVENRVFAGDVPTATVRAQRLRTLLPELLPKEAVIVTEVLIELAMRQPDIPAAWALLGQLRRLEPQRATLLSYEGQIHWFGGQVQAAHEALARMLERYPDYCRGIIIENDLAVMLQALGRINEAEVMAQRSPQSWAGVAHTETLSLLVLGLVQTSAGRYAQADGALQRALELACEQSSPGFEAEALVRHARMLWQCGQVSAAQKALDRAALLLVSSPEPMRISQLVLTQVLCASAAGSAAPEGALRRLQGMAQRSEHPLVHVRLARVVNELAVVRSDWLAAAEAARDMAELARRAGLLEALAEALLLQACAGLRLAKPRLDTPERALTADEPVYLTQAKRACVLATKQGFADLRWRAASWLQTHATEFAEHDVAAQVAESLRGLSGSGTAGLFDAAAAARREPRWLFDESTAPNP